MTPDQRLNVIAFLQHHERGAERARSHAVTDDEQHRWQYEADAMRAVLAVLTPEAERDRRVGAAVMAWECSGCGHGAAHAYSGHLCVSCELCGIRLRRVIIAALREEANDA